MKKEDLKRILIEEKNGDVYAYQIMKGLNCSRCHIKGCEDLREMCCGLEEFGQDGCWQKKDLKISCSFVGEAKGVIDEVIEERKRQDKKWGIQNHDPDKWLMILGEEVGESNKAALEAYFNELPLDDYREELIQVAAVAIAAVESHDRRKNEAQKGN